MTLREIAITSPTDKGHSHPANGPNLILCPGMGSPTVELWRVDLL